MNLVFIYGPPAVGKLTVAKELSKIVDYKIFHNHLTQDLAREIYPEFSRQRFDLVNKIRLDIFDYVSKNNTDLIFTFVYSTDCDDKAFIKNVVDTVNENNGCVYFVQLVADKATLLGRVENDSRKEFRKINDKNKLSKVLSGNSFLEKVDYNNVLEINTVEFSALSSAKNIIKHFNL